MQTQSHIKLSISVPTWGSPDVSLAVWDFLCKVAVPWLCCLLMGDFRGMRLGCMGFKGPFWWVASLAGMGIAVPCTGLGNPDFILEATRIAGIFLSFYIEPRTRWQKVWLQKHKSRSNRTRWLNSWSNASGKCVHKLTFMQHWKAWQHTVLLNLLIMWFSHDNQPNPSPSWASSVFFLPYEALLHIRLEIWTPPATCS